MKKMGEKYWPVSMARALLTSLYRAGRSSLCTVLVDRLSLSLYRDSQETWIDLFHTLQFSLHGL